MRFRKRPLSNIFSDKSSLVLRALLREPGRHWKIPELMAEGVSEGQVINVLDLLQERGWLTRHRDWRNHFAQLTSPQGLLDEWTRAYRFDWNPTATYFSSDNEILGKIVKSLRTMDAPFALTMMSGARLVAPYVIQNTEHLYLMTDASKGEDVLRRLETDLLLPYPTGGGNIHFSIPYYQAALQKDIQWIGDLPVVSNLQLYLDLVNEPTTGADQAAWLAQQLRERGTPLLPPARATPSKTKHAA
jgi:hypothetical protein